MVKHTRTHHLPNHSFSSVPTADGAEKSNADPAQRIARFEILLRQFEPLVYSVCRTLTGSEADADRSCEQAFVEVFHSDDDPTHSPARFLHETLRVVLERATPILTAPAAELSSDRVWALISGLPADDRQLLVLRFVGRLEIADLGGLLGIDDQAVKNRLWEAMTRLQGTHQGEN